MISDRNQSKIKKKKHKFTEKKTKTFSLLAASSRLWIIMILFAPFN